LSIISSTSEVLSPVRALPDGVDASFIDHVVENGALLHIDGEAVPALRGGTFLGVDPFTGEAWYSAADGGAEDVDRAVKAATAAQLRVWGRMTATERARVLLEIADAVEADADAIGLADTLDNGKLFRETRGQAMAVAHQLRYAAGGAERIEGVTAPGSKNDIFAMTVREPYGVVGIIIPWNSPLPQLIGAAADALAAGNAIVVKTSEDAPVSVLRFARLAEQHGLPAGVFNVVSGNGPEAGQAIVDHPGISFLMFTGGGAVGRKVAARAAERLVPTMLELGGKSPQIILADADLDRVMAGLVGGIFAAGGQSCVAGGRALVHRDVYEEVTSRMAALAADLRFGDPLRSDTQFGPLGSDRQTRTAVGFVESALNEGARLLAGGGTRPSGVGHGPFFEPAVVADVHPSSRLFQEEVFGPVIGFTVFDDIEEALALANNTRFGLAAGVWTRDLTSAMRLSRGIVSGTVWVNTYRAPELALSQGGHKESGYGRFGGSRGALAFTREKTIVINHCE